MGLGKALSGIALCAAIVVLIINSEMAFAYAVLAEKKFWLLMNNDVYQLLAVLGLVALLTLITKEA